MGLPVLGLGGIPGLLRLLSLLLFCLILGYTYSFS